jgi:hypothetical protein
MNMKVGKVSLQLRMNLVCSINCEHPVKAAVRMKKHVKATEMMKLTVTTKKREGAVSEVEKLLELTMWMDAEMQKRVPLSLMTMQAKARNLFENLKGKISWRNADVCYKRRLVSTV